MNQTKLTVKEAKDLLKYTIKNNIHLQTLGKKPVAISFIGDAGLGKTSLCKQVAKEVDLIPILLSLSQLDELGDLLGFPVRQFQLCKGTGESKECLWIDEPAVEEYIKQNYQFTGEKRMVHAEPEWIAGKTEGLCLILDDYSRAQPRFLQAIMELVQNQEYMSWRLPQGSTVVLTSNPDNGQYHVEAQDLAQTSRAISYELKSDIECWAQWAETEGIIGLGINFMLLHPELLTEKCNPRSITNFFNAISSIKDLEAELPLVQLIAEGSVGPEVGTMFTMFVNNKLHLLVSPKQILTHKDWSHIKGLLTECIGVG